MKYGAQEICGNRDYVTTPKDLDGPWNPKEPDDAEFVSRVKAEVSEARVRALAILADGLPYTLQEMNRDLREIRRLGKRLPDARGRIKRVVRKDLPVVDRSKPVWCKSIFVRKCKLCGIPHDHLTPGCGNCETRHQQRAKRSSPYYNSAMSRLLLANERKRRELARLARGNGSR